MSRRASSDDGAATYAAAANSALLYDFVMGTLSANQAIRWNLSTLRNRARELQTRNGHASRIPQLFAENVVGEYGVQYQAAVKLPDGSPDTVTNDGLEDTFYRWAESREATVDRSLAWCEVEALLEESEVTDGEVLLRHVRGAPNRFGYAVELLDPDQLDHTFEREATPTQNAIVMGIEVDFWGRPVAYHLWSNHPSERRAVRQRVPADQIIHRFLRRRIRQMRGVTMFAPMLIDLSHHGGMREAHLVAARIAGAKMGFLQLDKDAEAIEDWAEDGEGNPVIPWQIRPGLVDALPRGVEFKQFDPNFPNTNFSEFDTAILRSIATAARLSYSAVSGDLTKSSFSSERTGELRNRRVYRFLTRRHVREVSQPVLDEFLRMAALSPMWTLQRYDVDQLTRALWHGPRQEWIDPQKDLEARKGERQLGLTSCTRIAAERGDDWFEIVDEIAAEETYLKRRGITLPGLQSAPGTVPGAAPARPGASDDADPDEEDDEEDTRRQPAKARALTPGRPARLLRRINAR